MDGLTDRQLQVVRFLKSFEKRNGYYATVRDVADYVGWDSTSTAHQCLRALERKGFVVRKHVTRSTTVFTAAPL